MRARTRRHSTAVIIIFSFVFKNVFDFSAVTCFAFVFTAVLYKYDTRRRPGYNTGVVVVVDTAAAAAAAAIRVRGKRFASAAAVTGSEVLAYRLKV